MNLCLLGNCTKLYYFRDIDIDSNLRGRAHENSCFSNLFQVGSTLRTLYAVQNYVRSLALNFANEN